MSGFRNKEDGSEECDREEPTERRNAGLHERDLFRQDWYTHYKPNERLKGEPSIVKMLE